MSEILQLSESGQIDVVFAKSGVPSTVTPAPTFELRRVSDNTLIDSGTLAAVGNYYPYTFSQAGAALYRLTVTTTDASADYPTYIETIRAGQTWIQYQDAAISSRTKPADTQAAVTLVTTTTSVTNPVTVGTNNDKTGYSLAVTPPTAATIADAVWDEALAGHLTPGSTGEALDNAGGGGVVPTVQQIVDGVWDEANSAHVIADSTGANLADILAKVMLLTSGSYTIALQSGFTQSGDIEITQGQSYLAALGTELQATVTGLSVDPTGGTFPLVVFNRSNGVINSTISGTLVSYSLGTAVIQWELSAAASAAFNPPNASTPGGAYIYEFTAKIVYPASAGTIIPIPVREGTFKVNFTPP